MQHSHRSAQLLTSARRLLVDPDPRRQRWAVLALLALAGLAVGLVVGVAGPIVALALAVAGIGAWLVLQSPLWGLVGVVLVSTILPFATAPFDIGVTPTFLDMAVFATFGVWALNYAVRAETRFKASSIGLAVALFLALAAFTYALGLQYARPTPNNLRQFLEMVISISLFFVVINVVRTRAQLFFLARAIMVGGAVAASLAILFYILPREITVNILDALARLGYPGGFGALRFVNDDPEGLMRAIGTSVDPNVLGGLMILVGLVTLPQLFVEKPLFPRRWIMVMVGLDILALYLTISRGAMLGFAAGAVVVGLFRYRKLLVIAFIAAVLFFIMPFTQAYVQHLLAGFAGQDRATQMRFGEYKDALTLISRYPVFGVGFIAAPEIDLYIGVSSLYLLMAENMGLVGLTAFLITILFFVNALIRALRHRVDAQLDAILLGALGAISGLMVAGVFDHYLFNLTYPHMTSLLWILIGMGMAAVGFATDAAS